jgi:aspartate/glutamate racemase
MACNSLSRAAALEAARHAVPFVDMIAATTDAVRASGADAAVLIATPATYAARIYDGHGVEMMIPPDALRREAAELIARTVEGPPATAEELRALVDRTRQPGAAVVLGCTDICGMLEGSAGEVVESLDCLAAACAQRLCAGAGAPR